MNPRRILGLCALAAAVLGVAVFFFAPTYSTATEGTDGPAAITSTSVIAVNGAGALGVGLLPIAIAAIPLLLRPERLRPALGMSAALLSSLAIVGAASIGMFIAPAALISWIAFLLPRPGARAGGGVRA